MDKVIRRYGKAKGFTLVEVLIVIIIIGILAGMMMLSTGAATDKAEATKIISNMRNAKAGIIMFYADNNRWPAAADEASVDTYLDTKLFGAPASNGLYAIETTISATGITYDMTAQSSGIKTKLRALANEGSIVVSGDNMMVMRVKE